MRINPKHVGHAPRGVAKIQSEKESGEGDHVSASFPGGEVSPAARYEIDLEASGLPVRSPWVASHPFAAFAPAVRKPTATDSFEMGKRRFRDALKSDGSARRNH